MALSDNMRLYDIATRQQVYVEGVKVKHAREFNFILAELRIELKRLFSRIKYKTLDGLTKAELHKFVIALRESQSKIYNNYTQDILKQLYEFMQASAEINRRAFVYAKIEDDEETSKTSVIEIPSDEQAIQFIKEENSKTNIIPLFGIAAVIGNNERLWSNVTNAPIPANGLYLHPFVKTFAVSAQAGVENTIRKAWANGWTVEETLQELTGEESRQGSSSQLQRVGVQASAVISTAIQHVAAITGAAVASALFSNYVWRSVMDGKTTEICASRNGRRYQYGRGPLPPAHIRCRSHISPSVGISDTPDESFYTWIARQPEKVQDDILNVSKANDLRKGVLKAKELPKFESTQVLNLNEFRNKIDLVLSR